jgi:peptide/nickel transport system substrate-binding protein
MKKRLGVMGIALVMCLSAGASSALAAQPQKGGSLVFGSVTEVASLDPHVYQGTAWKTINLCLYNSLLGFDEKGRPTGALAESWETPDAKTIVFHLRKGVKFHKAQAFTAADVKYSLERILDAATGATLRSNLKGVNVTVVDDYTVKVEKDVPDVTLLSVLAMGETAIVSSEWMKTGPNVKIEANGTGPFVVVERNADYFEKDLPHLDKIEFRMIKNGDARVNALKQVPLTSSIPCRGRTSTFLKPSRGLWWMSRTANS